MGAGVRLSDSVSWLTPSFGGVRLGTETESLADYLGVYHDMNATVCYILGAPDMCYMVAIEHLACVIPLDE